MLRESRGTGRIGFGLANRQAWLVVARFRGSLDSKVRFPSTQAHSALYCCQRGRIKGERTKALQSQRNNRSVKPLILRYLISLWKSRWFYFNLMDILISIIVIRTSARSFTFCSQQVRMTITLTDYQIFQFYTRRAFYKWTSFFVDSNLFTLSLDCLKIW